MAPAKGASAMQNATTWVWLHSEGPNAKCKTAVAKSSGIPGLMIDQYHPEAAWSLQLFPHVFSPLGASFLHPSGSIQTLHSTIWSSSQENPGCAVFSEFFWGGCPSDFLPHSLSPPSHRPTPLINTTLVKGETQSNIRWKLQRFTYMKQGNIQPFWETRRDRARVKVR